MDRTKILDLYRWDTGVCFRHPGEETDTAVVKILQIRPGRTEDLRACRDCVLSMERARKAAAEGAGVPYVPGHAGEVL